MYVLRVKGSSDIGYVGTTVNPRKRFAAHISKPQIIRTEISKWIQSVGYKNIEMEVFVRTDYYNAFEIEQSAIKKYHNSIVNDARHGRQT